MSKILDKAVDCIKSLPETRQDEIGEMLMAVVEQDQSKVQLSAAQQDEVRRRMGETEPVYATDEQVEAFFSKLAG